MYERSNNHISDHGFDQPLVFGTLSVGASSSTYKKGECVCVCVCVFPRKNLHVPRITFFRQYIGDLINQPFSSPMAESIYIKLHSVRSCTIFTLIIK